MKSNINIPNEKSGKSELKPLEFWRLIILKTLPKPLSSTVGLNYTITIGLLFNTL